MPVTTQGLIPPESLAMMRGEAAKQFDCNVTWFPANPLGQGLFADDGDFETNGIPVPARVVKRLEAFYNQQGTQLVSTMRIYLPLGTAVKAQDKLIPPGGDPLHWGQILDIANVPTEGESVMLRVRTGPIQ